MYAPTQKKHAEEWPLLVQRLVARTLVLPKHARLREELLNVIVEVGPQGVRVIDRGRVHRDHAVAVRGFVAMLSTSDCAMSEKERLVCLAAGATARPSEEPDPEAGVESYDDWTEEPTGLPWARRSEMF